MLVVEDNTADIVLIREAIQAADLGVAIDVVKDGEQARRFFDRLDSDASIPCPRLVILDINLPRWSGSEVLKHMRRSERCRDALVLAISSSESARDRQQMAELGANEYFRKPSEYDAFMELGEAVKRLLQSDN